MFVVTFAGTSMKALKSKDERQLGTPWFAFFKPWNAVRDSETYSLTYLTPSVINGIEYENGLPMDSIVRSKLSFRTDGMDENSIAASTNHLGGRGKNKNVTVSDTINTHKLHALVNPVIYLCFDKIECAKVLSDNCIYGGRFEYPLYSGEVEDITEDEFDSIPGVETFKTNEEMMSIFCGFNRYKNNEKMYVNIVNSL